MPTLQFHGCPLEPLGDYLKALGIFRLVSEQITTEARCWWKHGVFHLWLPTSAAYRQGAEAKRAPQSNAECREWIEAFLRTACVYSPFIAPWQKNTGWHPKDTGAQNEKGSRAMLRALGAQGAAMNAYNEALGQLVLSLPSRDNTSNMGLGSRLDHLRRWISQTGYSEVEKREALFRWLRNSAGAEAFTAWMDTVAHAPRAGDPNLAWFRLLGKTGAGEGRGAYIATLNCAYEHCLCENSEGSLRYSLWNEAAAGALDKKFSIGLFYPNRKGDPNMGQRFERLEMGNAWDVVLLFEGTLLFAGGLAKRLNAHRSAPAFPFYCASSLGGNPSSAGSEIEGSKKGVSSGEVWCPVWSQPATLRDLAALFSEGRMQIGGRDARLATQFIRALGRHGCDRGIAAFQRYGLIRRSGSYSSAGQDQTSTLAVPLGLYTASPNSDLALLDDMISFEEAVLDASGGRAILDSDSQPRRIIQARLRFEEALFEASRSGLESHRQEKPDGLADFRLKLMDVAVAAARVERECGVTDGRVHDREGKMADKDSSKAPCAPVLSYDWLRLRHVSPSSPPRRAELSDDGTPEWRLARAIGTLCPWGNKPDTSKRSEPSAVGPVRENLAPVMRSQGGGFWDWDSESRRAVWLWERATLGNCAAVLRRRLIDAQAGSGRGLPVFSPYGADAADVLALWEGAVAEDRTNQLVHGFALIRPWPERKPPTKHAVEPDTDTGVESDKSGEVAQAESGGFPGDEPASEAAAQPWVERLHCAAQLPRAYALLKLCFLGGRLAPRPGVRWSGDEPFPPGNLDILNLLLAGRADEACAAAGRRLHYVGYPPIFTTSQSFSAGFTHSHEECRRLAGLLLVPITFGSELATLIIKPSTKEES